MSGMETGLAFIGFAAAFGTVRPSGLAESQKDAIKDVIARQIEAFRSGDAAMAFSFASAPVRRLMRSPEVFARIVRDRYLPVHSPKDVEFLDLKVTHLGLTQAVRVTAPTGEKTMALYVMGRDHGGPWKIGAVHLPHYQPE
jgi:hypothetical protein